MAVGANYELSITNDRRPFPYPSFPLSIIPAPTVIPAKAGIHTPAYHTPTPAGVLDSGLRRNDGVRAGE